MSLLQQLGNIPRRIIFLLTIIVLIWPLFLPWNLPVAISPEVEYVYEHMSALEGTGGAVLFLHFIPPVFWGEMQHLAYSPIQHMFKMEDVKLVIASMTPMGEPLIGRILDEVANPLGKEYGVDYVLLPFMPGATPAAFALLAEDFGGAYSVDQYGTPIDEITCLDGLDSLDDFAIVYWCEPAKWQPLVAQVFYPRYPDIDYFFIAIAEGFNFVAPYLGNVYPGGLIGVRPAAEYQTLFGGPFTGAVAQMDAISGYHVFAILLLILGNVAILSDKLRKSGVT
jgi:hypothetical protein